MYTRGTLASRKKLKRTTSERRRICPMNNRSSVISLLLLRYPWLLELCSWSVCSDVLAIISRQSERNNRIRCECNDDTGSLFMLQIALNNRQGNSPCKLMRVCKRAAYTARVNNRAIKIEPGRARSRIHEIPRACLVRLPEG